MSRTTLIVAILLAASPAMAELRVQKPRDAHCTLWEHRDMQGARKVMANGERVTFARNDVGSSAWRESPTWNDHVSSATIDRGCRLQVWEHVNASGKSKTWSGGPKGLLVKYVGSEWNDRISSATCYCDQ
jgi:hypothetical protein